MTTCDVSEDDYCLGGDTPEMNKTLYKTGFKCKYELQLNSRIFLIKFVYIIGSCKFKYESILDIEVQTMKVLTYGKKCVMSVSYTHLDVYKRQKLVKFQY